MYIPFFYVGVLAVRNDWLTSVEEMSMWVRWAVRTITIGMMVTIALLIMKTYSPIPALQAMEIDTDLAMGLMPPPFAIAMGLTVLQLFHQYFNQNPQNKVENDTTNTHRSLCLSLSLSSTHSLADTCTQTRLHAIPPHLTDSNAFQLH